MSDYASKLESAFNAEDKSLSLSHTCIDTFVHDIAVLLTYDYEYPGYKKEDYLSFVEQVEGELFNILTELEVTDKEDKLAHFMDSLPDIRKSLNTTIEAILQGDPASISHQQIVLMYPGFTAILYYRVGREFLKLGLPFTARYLAEYAHSHTGIDINPGAEIGEYFFIDHGTGIVIGETAVIGNNVKLYQGVTLGALSLSKGRDLQGKKRHPSVEDNVTIYSNAAIFGGDTVIGEGSIIGGNVYLTHSVPPHSIVKQTDDGLTIINK
ncbi:MAG: serine acetyltransferase [Bacilli bacterium]|nr:serine acetyltransferase [Bacilli bacterium]